MRGRYKINYNKKNIPQPTIHRLTIYLRCLELLVENENGKKKEMISSSELSIITGINSHQIRKDLAYFGGFGKRGIGYPIQNLIITLKGILGSSKKWDIILAGVGNLGEALLRYKGYKKRGFNIIGAFDKNPSKVGKRINNIELYDIQYMKTFIIKRNIKIGIITVPAQAAQEVAEIMVNGGIKSILNFAPIVLKCPDYVTINTIDISIELERLVYYLSAETYSDN